MLMDLKFLKPVYIGETVTCEFKITEITHKNRAKADVIFTNQNGIVVLTAVITGVLPDENEREILRKIQKNCGINS